MVRMSILDIKWFQLRNFEKFKRHLVSSKVWINFFLSFAAHISVCACFLKLWGNFNYLTHRSFKLKFEWERRAGFSAIFLVISKHFLIFLQIKLGEWGGRGNHSTIHYYTLVYYPYNFTQVSPKYLLNRTHGLPETVYAVCYPSK